MKTFLYLTANFHVLNFVAQFFRRTQKNVYFGLLDEFRGKCLDMQIMEPSAFRGTTLNAVLVSGGTAKY